MLFKIVAPFYDRFMKGSGLDYSSRLAAWLAPVEGKDLLDLGGGTGINAGPLALAGARVTVVDSSGSMLSRARAKNINCRLVRGDAANLPFTGGSFDIVLISDAWHHFTRQGRVMREVERVLRPGGRLCIIDFDRDMRSTRVLALLERLAGEPSTFWRPANLQGALGALGIHGDFQHLSSNQYLYRGVKDEAIQGDD